MPHPSLAFRWHYWTAAVRAFVQAPLTGIGRGNFADAYLLYKPAESTEDVRDPHNLWLSLLVELGPAGLLAGGLLLTGCVHGVLRRINGAGPAAAQPPRMTAGRLAAATGGVLLLQVVFSGVVSSRALLVLWTVELAAVWLLSFVLITWLLDHLFASPAKQKWWLAGLAAALAGALIHGLIDFALLTPAGLSLFVALAAAAFALRSAGPSAPALPAKIIPAAVGGLLVATHLALVMVPTMRVEYHFARMRNASFDRHDLGACEAVLALGREALASDPLDAAAALEVARTALGLGANPRLTNAARRQLLGEAESLALIAQRRNPRSSGAHVCLADVYAELDDAWLLDNPDEARRTQRRSLEEWQTAVTLRPSDPRLRISAAEAGFAWWDETHDPAAARGAAQDFAAALRIDATRTPEEVVRLREGELALIHDHLRVLERAGFGIPGTSAPASAPTP